MKTRHLLAVVMVTCALAAVGIGLHTISLRFVEWGEPLPWEDGKPYLAKIDGERLSEGVMVLLGPTIVGRVSNERGKNGEPVMRIQRSLKLGRESRFELHVVDATKSVVIIPAGAGQIEPWDVVAVEAPPSRQLSQER